MLKSSFKENVRVAAKSLRSQLLRASITVSIIAIGITALVGILTSIDAIKSKINSEFSVLGSNTFTVMSKGRRGGGGRHQGIAEKVYPPISYREAQAFEGRFAEENTSGKVSLSATGSFTATVKYGNQKSNPNIRVIGGSEHYLEASGYDLLEGRNFSAFEQTQGTPVVILGSDIPPAIFKNQENPIGKQIFIGTYRYTVIGVLKSKGNSLGIASDTQCIIPLENVRKTFATSTTQYSINVYSEQAENLSALEDITLSQMRQVRKDRPGKGDSFEIIKSDQLVNTVLEATSLVRLIATFLAVITLLGAGIGLMNIMLASVTERTREIGVRKAMGASQSVIRQQFLIESILIGQLGGIFGILFGILCGFGVSFLIGSQFNIPWIWILSGILLCLGVSIASGYYPAKKAADLDPIDALRHE